MLRLEYDIKTQLDNPILCAILLSLIFIVVSALIVSGMTFAHMQQIFVVNAMLAGCLLFVNYRQLKDKFNAALMNYKSDDVVSRLTAERPVS